MTEPVELEHGVELDKEARAQLGQDVILAGLENGVDSKSVLTEVMEVLGMTNLGYANALGSLVAEGYVVVQSDQSEGLKFELTDKGREAILDDKRHVGEVHEIIQGVVDKNDVLRQKGNQVLTTIARDPIELAS